MTEEVKKTTESEWRLKGLRNMIKEVYMGALEQKASGDEKSERNEIVHNMNKFCGNIQTSLQQAYGNVTLQIPDIPLDMDETEVVHNPSLMKELDSAVEDWAETIKDTIEKANKNEKNRVHDTASGETDHWRNRSALFNTLHQQLSKPQVKLILRILETRESNENNILDDFKQAF